MRRNVVDTRRGARAMERRGSSGGGASFTGVIDDVITAGGVAPRHASSTSHRLYSAYTGPLFRLRRASDDAQIDIGYDPATNRTDEAAIAAFCGASDGFIVTRYDQSGLGNDVTQAVTGSQAKLYDGATASVLKQGTLPWATTTGTGGYERGDSIGITGSPGITSAYFGSCAAFGVRRAMFGIGNIAVSAGNLICGVEATTGDPLNAAASFTRHRTFTETTALSTPSFLVHRLGAGAQIGASTVRQDGVDLVESSVNDGTAVPNITNVAYSLQSRPGGTWPFNGGYCFAATWGAHLTGAPLAALESFGALLLTLD